NVATQRLSFFTPRGSPNWREPYLPPLPNDVATRELGFSGHRAVLARSREPNCWRRLFHAQKEHKVPQANCRQDRRRVRAAELDFGLSCTECTENGGRTSRADCSVSSCNMRN